MGARRAKRQSQAGRIVLVDPAFRDERTGHHARLNQGYAELFGPDRCWLAGHRSIGTVSGVAPERVVPAFAVSFYDSAELRRLGPLRRRLQALVYQDLAWIPRQVRVALQSLRRRRSQAKPEPAPATASLEPIYLAELVRLIDDLGLGFDDHLVFTSLDAQMGRSILELLVQRGLANLPSLHLRLMYDDDTVADGGLGYGGLVERLVATGCLGGRLELYSETRTHALALQQRLGAPVGVAPYPAKVLPPPAPPVGRPLTAAFLGEARSEKGIDWLPDVIAAFERRYPELRERVSWLIHAGGQTIEAATIRDRLRASRSRSGSAVTHHFGSLSPDVYERHLIATDIVLALQDPTVYARRGSGVAQEAVAAGRPLICRAGTSMAQEAGAGTLVVDDAEGVAAAIARVVSEPGLWFERAAADARRFSRRLAQSDLVRDCESSRPPVADRPVALIAACATSQQETGLRLNLHAEALAGLGYQVIRAHLTSGSEPAGAALARAFEGDARDRHTVASFEVRGGATGGPAALSPVLQGLSDGARLEVVLADDAVAQSWIDGAEVPQSVLRFRAWAGGQTDEMAAPGLEASPWQEAPATAQTPAMTITKLRQAWRRRLKQDGPPHPAGSRPAANRV